MATNKDLAKLRHLPPTHRFKYPHMYPLDVEVWERFLDKYRKLYDSFVYDCKVGKKTKIFPHWEPNYKRNAEELSQLRIDVLGFRDNTVDVIEVKPRFTSSAIGQVLTYCHCLKKDYQVKKPIRPVVVAGEIDPNLQSLLEDFKIVYLQV